MKAKYGAECLRALVEKARFVTEDGLDILVKPIPEGEGPGRMDPRLYASMAPMFSGLRGVFARKMMKRMGGEADPKRVAARLRGMMDGVKSVGISEGVMVEDAHAPNGHVAVPLRVYTPEKKSGDHTPVLLYFHGGGFVGGNLNVVDEMCRVFTMRTGWACVSADYRLAPENPFPAGLEDCYAALRWTVENAERLNGDPGKVCVCGDSAGGNLAAVCAIKDREDKGQRVWAQALIYPTVNMAGKEDEGFRFSLDAYAMDPSHAHIITAMIDMMRGAAGRGLGGMLKADPLDPHVSPYLGDLHGLPPAVILYGEHDYLRVECEAYARKLQSAGCAVRAVRYEGLGHGFADAVGVYPQAEDCLMEIIRFMQEREEAHL